MPSRDEDRDLMFTPVHDLARMIRAKELSPVELAEAVFRRVSLLDPKLNAFLTLCEEDALRSARRAADDAAKGRFSGPLHGMPVGIKDLYDTGGVRTTYGSLAHKDHVPRRDGLIAKRLKEAGCILVGKTNAPEYGCANFTENRLGGPCRNPWDTERSSGGSSGGAGAAVAAGLCPLCPGSDGGGSIRIPSSLCGLFGLKPTYGRIPYDVDPVYGPAIDFICHGPMTRTVRDAAFLLNAMSGPDEGDYNTIGTPRPDYVGELDGKLKPLRIAWSPDLGFAEADPEVRSTVEAAVRVFERMGHLVEEAAPRIDEPFETWEEVASALNSLLFGSLLEEHPDELTPYFRASLELGKRLSGAEVIEDWIEVGRWRAEMKSFMQRYDLLMTPTTAVPAFPNGLMDKKTWPGMVHWKLTPFTPLFNFTHNPAASIPCGFTRGRLPVGLHVVGRLEDEATVLKAAYAFEQERPWAGERPPVS